MTEANGPFKRGTVFRHGRILDPSFVPGPGQRLSDAPKALCRVTAVRRRGIVYYGIGADTNMASAESLLRSGAQVIS